MAGSGQDLLYKGSVVALIVLFFSVIFYDLLSWVVFEQSDLGKFPLIYGIDGCNFFTDRSINVKFDWASILLSLITSKVYFYAYVNHNESLIFKKSVSKSELTTFDKDNDYTAKTSIDFTIDNLVESVYVPFGSSATYKLRICPSKESVVQFIRYYNGSAAYVSAEQLIPSLWIMFQLNPEPVILSLLRPPEWPVPRYYGSCGRLSVFDYCGRRLTDLVWLPYSERLDISYQIFSAAWQFTFGHPRFAFYLTDISPDNIVVDSAGSVKFVDFEHVIIVDKSANVTGPVWNVNHTSQHVDCKDCLSFSPDDLCSHRLSDHNIYAVCKEIFSESSLFPKGFLHSVDSDAMTERLSHLIQSCLTPGDTGPGRFGTAQQILLFFESILHF